MLNNWNTIITCILFVHVIFTINSTWDQYALITNSLRWNPNWNNGLINHENNYFSLCVFTVKTRYISVTFYIFWFLYCIEPFMRHVAISFRWKCDSSALLDTQCFSCILYGYIWKYKHVPVDKYIQEKLFLLPLRWKIYTARM